ncbi:ladderlectin-like [Myxocyprinus asiaticus]|uniref:ladderlectin-like n=1 Tax=Myxocyprinus asiaticus TaxID=70543 RepID=UPI002222D717|nr:ladderlectin-like [Myxocyprinus asiaticus]
MAVMRTLLLLVCMFTLGNTTAEKCPFGWTPFGEQCYRFFSQQVNWVTAEKNCLSLDANLASVHSKADNDFLLSLLSVSGRSWVGGSDGVQDGQWLWSDGTTFDYTNWCSIEPNNNGGSENCLEINWTGNHCWNDITCSASMGYICAKGLD